MKRCEGVVIIAVILLFAVVQGTQASPIDPAIGISGGTLGQNALGFTFGWEFKVGAQDITVDALGFYEAAGSPLAQDHAVGIFNSSGVSIVKALVTGSGILQDSFRWVSITPQVLTHGMTYTIVALQGGDKFVVDPTQTVDPRITYNHGVSDTGDPNPTLLDKLARLDSSAWAHTYYGPNLSIVPLPGALLLLAPGLAGLAVIRRRLKK